MDAATRYPKATAAPPQLGPEEMKLLPSFWTWCQPVEIKPNIFGGGDSREAELRVVRDRFVELGSVSRSHEARREETGQLAGLLSVSLHTCCFASYLAAQLLSAEYFLLPKITYTTYMHSCICLFIPSLTESVVFPKSLLSTVECPRL